MVSNAQRIKKDFRQLLDDGQPHTRKELFEYARRMNPDVVYSEGMLTGALKTLTDSGMEYKCVSRATYQKVEEHRESGNAISSLIAEYVMILKDSLSDIDREVVDPFIILELNEDDKRRLREIQKCVNVMRRTIEIIEE